MPLLWGTLPLTGLNDPANRTLIVGPSWVGDMVMAQSLFKVLREKHPDTPIDVLAPAWSLPILDRMPEVDQGIIMPLGHGKLSLGARWQLGKSLRGRYQQAILLPNSWKSALLPFAAKISRRTGWVGEMRYGLVNDIRTLDKQHLTMTVQRFCALAHEAENISLPETPAPQLVVSADDVTEALRDLELEKSADVRVLALCPGAEFGPAKCWPTEYYMALARRYREMGWQIWLFGSEKDREACAQIEAGLDGDCQNLAGRTSLAQAVDLLSVADAAVSNDSGLMHVAAALEIPLVAIYGSTDPGFTPPLSENHKIARLGLDCSPCFQRECPLGHMGCLNKLDVDQVDQHLKDLL